MAGRVSSSVGMLRRRFVRSVTSGPLNCILDLAIRRRSYGEENVENWKE